MKVILVAKSRALERLFSAQSVRFEPVAELESVLAGLEIDEMVYLDSGSFARKAWEELVARLSANGHVDWAVIDRDRAIADPGALFHAGALDIVTGDAPEGFVDERRIAAIVRFAESKGSGGKAPGARNSSRQDADQARAKAHRQRQSSFGAWDELTEGKEHEFLMVYMGLWDAEGLRTRLGDTRFAKLKANVAAVAESLAVERDGIVWISDGQSALELFRPDALPLVIASCLRILANMPLVSYEQLRLDQESVSLCLSMQIASAPWFKPGNTGTIVADSINYIFHLGRKFTPPGVIDLVDNLASSLSPRLTERISPAGIFEGKPIGRFSGFFHPSQS